MKFDNFHDLLEVVSLQNFDKRVEDGLEQNIKKAVKIGPAFKKAVKTGEALPKKVRKGKKFTDRKPSHHGRVVHFTNNKNAFIRTQKRKSKKGKKK